MIDPQAVDTAFRDSLLVSRDPEGKFEVEKFRRGFVALSLNAIIGGGWKLERITEPIPEGLLEATQPVGS